MADITEISVPEDGAVFETLRVRSTLKRDLLDLQDEKRRELGKKLSMSELISVLLDSARSSGKPHQAIHEVPQLVAELWTNPKNRIELNMRNAIAAYLELPELKGPKPR